MLFLSSEEKGRGMNPKTKCYEAVSHRKKNGEKKMTFELTLNMTQLQGKRDAFIIKGHETNSSIYIYYCREENMITLSFVDYSSSSSTCF